MRWLESTKAGVSLSGLAPHRVVAVAAVTPIGPDPVQVYYNLPDGTPQNALLTEADSARVRLAVAEWPWTFDGDPDRFKLVVEARRLELAHLLDPMNAIHTSNVQPLPHQITSVYEHLLDQQYSPLCSLIITSNEVHQGLNQGDKFYLALVFVGEHDAIDGPYYIYAPFERPLAWDDVSTNKSVRDLLKRAMRILA